MNVASPSERERPRVLITGMLGFTGQYLCRALEARSFDVQGIERDPQAGSTLSRLVHKADLLDAASLRRAIEVVQPNHVVHLAAIAFVGGSNLHDMYLTNILGTRNLLEALAVVKVDKLQSVLLASSANIYGNTTADPIDESEVPNPANDYAVSKLSMEKMAALWRDELPITIVRPFNYTGLGQVASYLVPKITAAVRDRAPAIELGNTHVERDFCDVRDVVSAYCDLLSVPAGGVFNICSGTVYSLNEILKLAEEISGHSMIVRTNPDFVRANEVHRLRGSAERLRSVLGTWTPRPFRETLEWMILGPQSQ